MKSSVRSTIELGPTGQARITLEGNAEFCRLGESVRITVTMRGADGTDFATSGTVPPEKAAVIAELFRVWAGQ